MSVREERRRVAVDHSTCAPDVFDAARICSYVEYLYGVMRNYSRLCRTREPGKENSA